MVFSKARRLSAYRIRSCGKTDVGQVRKENQDSILVDSDNCVFVLADGMGGHQGGQRASLLATQVVGRLLVRGRADVSLAKEAQSIVKKLKGDARLTTAAVLKADEVIVKAGDSYQQLYGLGSTIVTLMVRGQTATIGHVGDSRVYRMRDGELTLLTEDHSMLNEIRKSGVMSEEDAERYPHKNKITRALGHLPDRNVDIIEEGVTPGDIFLMCSDGLTNVVSDEEIGAQLSFGESLPSICDNLINLANENGGPDNISVIVAQAV